MRWELQCRICIGFALLHEKRGAAEKTNFLRYVHVKSSSTYTCQHSNYAQRAPSLCIQFISVLTSHRPWKGAPVLVALTSLYTSNVDSNIFFIRNSQNGYFTE